MLLIFPFLIGKLFPANFVLLDFNFEIQIDERVVIIDIIMLFLPLSLSLSLSLVQIFSLATYSEMPPNSPLTLNRPSFIKTQ